MLDVKYSEAETQAKFDALQNRLNRLEFEEKRAKKLADLAEKRAADLIEARKRHFDELQTKKQQAEFEERKWL